MSPTDETQSNVETHSPGDRKKVNNIATLEGMDTLPAAAKLMALSLIHI